MNDAFKKFASWFDPSTHDEDKKARQALEQSDQLWDGLEVPELQNLALEKLAYQGDFSPTDMAAPEDLRAETIDPTFASRAGDIAAQTMRGNLADRTELGPTAFDQVSTDPRLKDAQMRALSQMSEIADGGGMTLRERADLEKVRGQTASADRGRRDAILQNMASRGMGGSGMELLASLQSNQAATDRDAQAGLDIAASAQERALNAMMQGGQMAGNLRSQDFGEQAQKASAKDHIAQFNAANANQFSQFNAGIQNDTSRFNIGNQMAADQFNANAANNFSQFNTGIANDSKQWNASALNNMAQYNQGNRLNVAQSNNDWRNKAGMAGWDANQNIHNQNVGIQNQQTQYNTVTKPQTQYDMNAQKVAGQSGNNAAMSAFHTARGDRKARQAGQNINGALGIASGGLTKFLEDDED